MTSTTNALGAVRTAINRFVDRQLPPAPTPAFNFRLLWYSDYDHLFAERGAAETNPDAAITEAVSVGRVLLCGRGGAAKTVLMRRLTRSYATTPDLVVVLIELKGWPTTMLRSWPELSSLERLGQMVSNLGPHDLSLDHLDALPTGCAKILIIDGLNEISTAAGQQVVEAADDFAAIFPNAAAVLTDRLVRRELPNPTRWRYATIAPLSHEEIDTQWRAIRGEGPPANTPSEVRSLWSSPFFLDVALKGTPEFASSSATILQELELHGGLVHEGIATAAEAAFTAYQDYESRIMPADFAQRRFGFDLYNSLLAAGALCRERDAVSFFHQLQHDALAALYIAGNVERWTPQHLDDLTFEASSFDALAMVVEQITSREAADRFVRAVYDWNIYGAAYALTESRPPLALGPSPEMYQVILAMLAIRHSDPLLATRIRSADAMRLFPPELAERYLRASSIEAVRAIVAEVHSDQPWFSEWLQIFRNASDYTITASIDDIASQASLRGWTVANMLRQGVSGTDAARLRQALREQTSETVRWRIVHALSGDPGIETADTLLELIGSDDSGTWVRYGAIRALIELAVRGSSELRRHVFSGIAGHGEGVAAYPKALNEFLASLFVANPPDDWYPDALLAIKAVYEATDDFNDRDRIREITARLKADAGV